MNFTKMQGCGNDYVYINCFEEKVEDKGALSIRLSERHFGVGSDGVIYICPSDKADFMMDMYNLDGSRGKMCGNGIRCVGKYVFDHGMTDKTEISVETLSGIKYLSLHPDSTGKAIESVTVDMGAPIFVPELVPLNVDLFNKLQGEDKQFSVSEKGCIRNFNLKVKDSDMRFTFVSMGNPHAITFIADTEKLEIEKYGPYAEAHEMFPEKANIEFIQVVDRGRINMRVWERGSAETFACGTGACASVVAAYLNGYTDNKVSVKLLGGTLDIEYDYAKDRVFMTGPAVTVFEGRLVQ